LGRRRERGGRTSLQKKIGGEKGTEESCEDISRVQKIKGKKHKEKK